MDALAHGASGCSACCQSFDRVWDIEWTRNPKQPQNILVAPRRVRSLVGEGQYDIVHTHTPVASFVTRYALKTSRKGGGPKVIYTAHGFHFHPQGRFYKNALFLGLERLAGQWTDYLVVINRDDENAAQRYRLVRESRIVYMPGIGIDTRYYSPESVPVEETSRIRQELGVRHNDPIFLMIAEFNPGKRHRDAIEALKRLSHERVHLVFAGTGPLMEQMRALASTFGLADRVHFLGHRDDIRSLLRASTALVLPSEREGLPRKVWHEGRPYGVEVVGDPHDVFAPGAVKHPLRPFFRWWFPQRLRRQCARACAAAYVTEHALQQRYPPAPDAFTTHYSSVELDEQAYASAPRVYHAPLVQARLVLVGSLEQMYKAPDVAIDAVALCVSRGLDICLTIVGDGKHRPELEARADRMGVSRQVTFTGKLSAGQAVREQLDQADLFVLPSRTEGLPRAMIEAMARGLPCIGSTVGGIPELLPDEDLVPPGDTEALANKIAEVLSDPARMTRSADRNLEKARTYHNDVLRARRIEFYTYVKETTEAWQRQKDRI